jgi:DNA repair protein RadC
MFDNIFQGLFGLACETKLLEACEWDEDRAQIVSELFSKTLEEMSEGEDLKSLDDVSDKIRSKLEGSMSENEIVILLEILSDSIDHFVTFSGQEEKYDN